MLKINHQRIRKDNLHVVEMINECLCLFVWIDDVSIRGGLLGLWRLTRGWREKEEEMCGSLGKCLRRGKYWPRLSGRRLLRLASFEPVQHPTLILYTIEQVNINSVQKIYYGYQKTTNWMQGIDLKMVERGFEDIRSV